MKIEAGPIALVVLLPALLAVGVLRAQSIADEGGPQNDEPRVQRVIAAGEIFSDSRLALSFEVPQASVVRLQARGNFMAVEVEPIESQAFFIYHTSYRIRRPEALPEISEVFCTCQLPQIPREPQFEIETSCEGTIGWNEVKRTVRLIREAGVLHVFHLTHRTDASELAAKILASLNVNREFRAPTN